jgi:hypothetical protein
MSPNSDQANVTPAEPSSGEAISHDRPPTSGDSPGGQVEGDAGQQERPEATISEAPRTSKQPIEQLGSMIKTPAAGAAISGTVVLGAAAAFGVLETTVAAGAAYVAYRLLRRKKRSSD